MEIKNHFSPSERQPPLTGKRKPAKQEFKADADINTIMKKFQKGEALNHVKIYQQDYGIASPVDLHAAMTLIARAQSMFEDLPSNVRNFFRNDPSEFLGFVQDSKNAEKAKELGIALAPEAEAAALAASSVSATTPAALDASSEPATTPSVSGATPAPDATPAA